MCPCRQAPPTPAQGSLPPTAAAARGAVCSADVTVSAPGSDGAGMLTASVMVTATNLGNVSIPAPWTLAIANPAYSGVSQARARRATAPRKRRNLPRGCIHICVVGRCVRERDQQRRKCRDLPVLGVHVSWYELVSLCGHDCPLSCPRHVKATATHAVGEAACARIYSRSEACTERMGHSEGPAATCPESLRAAIDLQGLLTAHLACQTHCVTKHGGSELSTMSSACRPMSCLTC